MGAISVFAGRNSNEKTFVSAAQLEQIAAQYPTPFHIYDEQGIRENARRLNAAFSWNPGFREYFAVKATLRLQL